MSSRYEIRIAGQVDSTAAAAFEGLSVTACGRFTVVRGELNQPACMAYLSESGLSVSTCWTCVAFEAHRATGEVYRSGAAGVSFTLTG